MGQIIDGIKAKQERTGNQAATEAIEEATVALDRLKKAAELPPSLTRAQELTDAMCGFNRANRRILDALAALT